MEKIERKFNGEQIIGVFLIYILIKWRVHTKVLLQIMKNIRILQALAIVHFIHAHIIIILDKYLIHISHIIIHILWFQLVDKEEKFT